MIYYLPPPTGNSAIAVVHHKTANVKKGDLLTLVTDYSLGQLALKEDIRCNACNGNFYKAVSNKVLKL